MRGIDLALNWPRRVFVGLIVVVVLALLLMVRIKIDTDPENMLSPNEPVRIFHEEVKQRFSLYDMVILAVEYKENKEGVFNAESLGRIYELAKSIEAVEHVVSSELIDLAHVDNIKSIRVGEVGFDWLLASKPSDQNEANDIRNAARRLPMLNGTLISEDGKKVAFYIPVKEKSYSYQVSLDIQEIIRKLDGPESYHFAGLAVAEDTFGFEMFKQMAISAPLAALVIFLLMRVFFGSLALIASPMIVAMATVIITMGIMIGLGFTVHIMSSMIPIFLMPIAVVDSVHILSEFSELYAEQKDARKSIEDVMKQLLTPMLYTSLTSAAGFFSLVFTPIPPVQVFGGFVGMGILLAFVLTVVIVPAYIVTLSSEQLQGLVTDTQSNPKSNILIFCVSGFKKIALGVPKVIVVISVVLFVVGAFGISLIQINDNPVRWFHSKHPIRVADDMLNQSLSGTYPAYLIFDSVDVAMDPIEAARKALEPSLQYEFDELLKNHKDDIENALDDLAFEQPNSGWAFALMAYEQADAQSRIFQQPEVLRWLSSFQDAMAKEYYVGKSTSVADIVRVVHRELQGGNNAAYTIPPSRQGVAQTLLVFQGSHRPSDLFHVVTPDYRSSAVWFQLRSGDNKDMALIQDIASDWILNNPPPLALKARWAGLTYINVVWQEKMVKGMLDSLLGAFVVVFIMMVILFRSVVFGVLSMMPLALTIVVIYGVTGIIGKDYDMPVAVLSSLSLGLSIDFAIHFLQRCRQLHVELGDWNLALERMFEEPARAIVRNAVVIAIGFLPLLLAPLVPYNTVGVLMAAIMIVSSAVTLFLLPAAVKIAVFGANI